MRLRRVICFLLLATLAMLGHVRAGADVLRVMAWPGYADPDIVKAFEKRTGAKVEVTVVDTDEQLWQRVSAEGAKDFDVFAVNTAELQRYIARGLVAPLDPQAFNNLGKLQHRFRKLDAIPGLVRTGKLYALPYTYSEMGLIYDPAQWPTPPNSIGALWDPKYRGKVLMYDGGTHGFSLAAQRMGKPSPFALSSRDWGVAVQQLIALRRNVLAYYTQPEQSVALYKEHRAAVMFANYGTQQVRLLKDAGVQVEYVIPREGALAWLDCWAITAPAKDKVLARAWLDYMLEKEPGQALIERQGLSSASQTDGVQQDRIIWLEPVEDTDKRTRLWERIVAGSSAQRVMAHE